MTKRLVAVFMVLLMLTFGISSVNADEVVYVTVENTTFLQSMGAPWDGALLEGCEIILKEGDTIQSVLGRAFKQENISSSGISDGYITEIGGICAGDAAFYSGWMITLNDWFTNYGISEMAVNAGDVVKCVYSCDMGADVGSDWGNTDTGLKALGFSAGEISFSKNITEYELNVNQDVSAIRVYPEAVNKNYQVRIYKNTTRYEGTYYRAGEIIDIQNGDILYIACGLTGWPSMNETDGGTVYRVNITCSDGFDIEGDGVTVKMIEDGVLEISSQSHVNLWVYTVTCVQGGLVNCVKSIPVSVGEEASFVNIGNSFHKLMILDEKLTPYSKVRVR